MAKCRSGRFFPGYGTYIWSEHGLEPYRQRCRHGNGHGNFLGTSGGNNNQSDLAAYFAGYGTYIWSANAGWSKIDGGAASGLAAVDLSGNGQNELLAYFPGAGMYEYQNGVGWNKYDNTSALPSNVQQALFATGNFQGGSVVDAAVGFTGTAGIWLDPPAGATSSGSSAQSNASSAAGPTPVTSQLNPAAFAPDRWLERNAAAQPIGSLCRLRDTADIALLGSYMASSFVTSSDSNGGPLISEAAQMSSQTTPLAQPHAAV